MKKPVKYFLVAVSSIVLLAIAAVLTITTLVDVERYKPKIEQLVTEKTGYPLTLGGKISLSLFPWVGLSFNDLQIDNPQGFVNKTFVHIDGFQARLKVLPLLSRNVEISSFVVSRPEIFLEKTQKGQWNWEKLTKAGPPVDTAEKKVVTQGEQGEGGFALQSLVVGEFSITGGRMQINDLQNNQQREVADFTLDLVDVSLDKPITLTMGAMLDGKPFNLKGSVGPIGADPGAGKINLDLVIQALDTLNIKTSGHLENLKKEKSYNLAVNIEPFNLKQLFTQLNIRFPVQTADPQVLDKIGLQANITGDATHVVLADGKMLLDDSTINLDLTAKDFARPDLAFAVAVDAIDLDRYLPPAATEQEPVSAESTTGVTSPEKTPSAPAKAKQSPAVNYEPLRKLVLKGSMKLGQVKVHGGTVNNIVMDIAARNGFFTLNSLGMELYEGNIAATGKLNVQKNIPVTALNLNLQKVQAGPLLKDFAQKEIIEGQLQAKLALNLQGDNGDAIKKSLNGTGDLLFQDGAVIGLDLAQMARTIKSGFTLQQQGEKPKTDFAELHAPFTITNGLVNTPETTLVSPFIRVTVMGDADLVSEALDIKIKPTVVGTIKGQGDEEQRSGVTVPVLVKGTFQAPQFSPDLESFVKERLPSEKDLGELIKTGKLPPESKEKLKEDVEQAKGLLKGLFGK